MQRVFDNLDFLYKVSTLRNKNELLLKASEEEIQVLCEIAVNLCKGRFILSSPQLRKLRPFVFFIRELCRKRSIETARKHLLKGDKVFGPLINPIIQNVKISSNS